MKKILYFVLLLVVLAFVAFKGFAYTYYKHTSDIEQFSEAVPELIDINEVIADAKKIKGVEISLLEAFPIKYRGKTVWEDPQIVIESSRYSNAITCTIDYIDEHNLTDGEHFCITKSAMTYLIAD